MKHPEVTIAIPAFKTEFLAQAINSALRQTYTNSEIIIVDDCSPNGVWAIVDTFNDNRLCYYRNTENIGKEDPSRNWNRCLELAKGEYICILCDDDIYEDTYIESMMSLAGKYPNSNVYRSGVKEVDSNGKTTNYYPLAPEHLTVEEYIWHHHSRNDHQTISEWMVRVSALRAIKGYVPCPKAWGSDCATIFRLAINGGVVSSPHRLVSFRRSSVNITGQAYSFNKQKILGWHKQCNVAIDIIKVSTHSDREMILETILKDLKQETKFLVKHSSVKELLAMIRKKEEYELETKYVIKGLCQNLLYILHIKHK